MATRAAKISKDIKDIIEENLKMECIFQGIKLFNMMYAFLFWKPLISVDKDSVTRLLLYHEATLRN